MLRTIFVGLTALALLAAPGCDSDGSGEGSGGGGGTPAEPATLTQVEAQVFAISCTFSTCHAGAVGAGGLNLQGDSYEKLVGVASPNETDKQYVVPGDPDASLLMERLVTEDTVKRMPQGTEPLDDARIELVRSWIADGAQDN